jgi:chromosome segregation ATPase
MKASIKIFVVMALAIIFSSTVKAQTYTPKVSKDSLGKLNARLEALKASAKVQELKMRESEEEYEVEKLRIKLLEANANAKNSAADNSNLSEKLKSSSVDAKTMEKAAKKAKSDTENAQKALERYNKQIAKVEDIRTQIIGEERKLTYKKPLIVYDYK